MSTKQTGDWGEELACRYLKKLGWRIIERNFRIRGGEIDIIALDADGELVFVEVKTRWSHEYGLPVESVTFWKIKFLLKAARFYLQKINWGDKSYRLDFVGVDLIDSVDNPQIELIKNITG